MIICYRGENHLMYYCPACERPHMVNGMWQFNNNFKIPDIKPSVKVESHSGDLIVSICHHFINDGMISYCGDCTHTLAGKTVPMESIPIKWLP